MDAHMSSGRRRPPGAWNGNSPSSTTGCARPLAGMMSRPRGPFGAMRTSGRSWMLGGSWVGGP
eukprot:7932586-Alexandrium_andersonii.AAC.1